MNAISGRALKSSAILALAMATAPALGALEGIAGKESDSFDTGAGQLEIAFLGHASLALKYQGKLIYVDPVSRYGDFPAYPGADLILVTHEHGDHLDAGSIAALSRPTTRVVLPEASRKKLGSGEALEHGAKLEAAGVAVIAVPAYNTTPAQLGYHPKERRDNGYVLEVGKLRIYVAGDTEPIPEMKSLGPIDIAFLPMNQPYTMTPAQVAAATRTIKPRILYPYHFGDTNTAALTELLAGQKATEVRLRKLP